MLKLGKQQAVKDLRNLKISAILKTTEEPPEEYDFDVLNPGIPTPMFANDKYGCCVISGRGHQTLRFEGAEQKRILNITDEDITTEYFEESGGQDNGLNMLTSLREWRKRGWNAAGGQYKIKAFAEVNPRDHREVKTTIFSDIGIVLGVALPDNWQEATKTDPWTAWDYTDEKPSPYNGHCVFVPAYNKKGPICVTWGGRLQMSWDFFDKYTDEAYAVIDAKNAAIDFSIVEDFLRSLTTGP